MMVFRRHNGCSSGLLETYDSTEVVAVELASAIVGRSSALQGGASTDLAIGSYGGYRRHRGWRLGDPIVELSGWDSCRKA